MAQTRFVTAMLAAVLTTHLFGVGTPVLADDDSCPKRCNLSHGHCTSSGVCRCQPGWEGENCDRCTRAPGCMHGTCHQPWQCNCVRGWGGPRCARDLQICERTQPCRNHATCINNGNGEYLCVCQRGFYGMRCEKYTPAGSPDLKPTPKATTKTTPTTTKPPKQCMHGGKCKIYSLEGGCDRCICYPGYVGRHCEVNVNDCLMRPCANDGKCFDLSNDFYCECRRGYTGRFCTEDVNECALPSEICYNGGSCRNTYGSFGCSCIEGFSGKQCEDKAPGSRAPSIPKIIRVVAASTEAAAIENDVTFAGLPPKPKVIRKHGSDVKMTRITHEVKITSVNGDFSAADNEVVIRSEVDRSPDLGDSSEQAMQVMTFVFVGLAVAIVAAIATLVWIRCVRNQANVDTTSDKKCSDVPKCVTISSAVDKAPLNNRNCAIAVETIANTVDELDEASMQVQPCLTTTNEAIIPNSKSPHTAVVSCCSPPPPYALSAVDVRRGNAPERAGYYVALPPSRQDLSQSRKSLTSHAMTSHNPEETSSLLEADSPGLSHKIVV